MKQLQVYNPNDGTWREIIGCDKFPMKHETFIDSPREIDCADQDFDSVRCVILKSCDPPKAFVLGEQMLASISEELRSRVRGWERSDGNVLVLLRDGKTVHDLSLVSGREDYHIILSPPAPEPQTHRELLEELLESKTSWTVEMQKKIELHLADTTE